MKVYVTGGTGYIGKDLVKRLLEDGEEVVAMYRSEKPPYEWPGLQWSKADLNNIEAMKKGMQGCEGVYHMAGLARLWHPDKDAFFTMNVEGTRNVIAAAEQSGVHRLVFTSSAVVFSRSIRTAITEEDPLMDPFEEDYAITKFLAQKEIIAAAKRGMQAVIVNPPRVYGPSSFENNANALNNLVAKYLRQSFYAVPGDGHFIGNYAFINDVIDGHIRAMHNGRAGECYILGGENEDYLGFYRKLEKVTGIKRKCIHVPKWVMDTAAELSETWASLSGKEPGVTHAIVNKIYSQRALSCDKAIRELGYQITPLEEGLSQTVAYVKNKNV
ncbi:MAG TPA: NAD-dependent epimerase/dehydratase family protein [Phnomibacter sp.]|nr:NAD-dependent epimerase/dehydratase family protein [Phnomibacter sp.]